MSKIGIIGGAGFIGSSLARHLSKSFTVKVLDQKPIAEDLKQKVEYRQIDVKKFDAVERGLKDVDIVIHAAVVQIPLINDEKRLGYEVNILGTQNVCEAVSKSALIKGMILSGSWHVIGERGLRGIINEEFGFRPEKVEDRARFYALCKIGQETIVRVYDEMSEKIYGTIRMGTALGEGMPQETAASIFIANGVLGKPLTPYKHSMHRPMLYIDVNDVCKAFELYIKKILDGEISKEKECISHIVNVFWPQPITILELAKMARDAIIKLSNGSIKPEIQILDKKKPILFSPKDKGLIEVDVNKVKSFLGLERLTDPRETIERIVKNKIARG